MSENTKGPEPTTGIEELAKAAFFSCDTSMINLSRDLSMIFLKDYKLSAFPFLCGMCYAAGRINGIREERARRAKKRGQTDA